MRCFTLLSLISTYFAVSATATYDVQVGYSNGLKFSPDLVTIQPGDTVRFKFVAGLHTVTMEGAQACQKADAARFDFRQPMGSTAEFMAKEPGKYPYYCAIGDHCQKGMRGMIIVQAEGAPAGGPSTTGTPGNPAAPAGAGPTAGGNAPILGAAINASNATNNSSSVGNGTNATSNATNPTSGDSALGVKAADHIAALGAFAVAAVWLNA